ncbi:hypothetical protein Hanom_Chr09g00789061 [Helianthus anomalus]
MEVEVSVCINGRGTKIGSGEVLGIKRETEIGMRGLGGDTLTALDSSLFCVVRIMGWFSHF